MSLLHNQNQHRNCLRVKIRSQFLTKPLIHWIHSKFVFLPIDRPASLTIFINRRKKTFTGISCNVRHINNGSRLKFDTKFSLNFTYVYMYK